jgi:hypothetical protein
MAAFSLSYTDALSFGADDTASKEAQIDAIDHVIKHPA